MEFVVFYVWCSLWPSKLDEVCMMKLGILSSIAVLVTSVTFSSRRNQNEAHCCIKLPTERFCLLVCFPAKKGQYIHILYRESICRIVFTGGCKFTSYYPSGIWFCYQIVFPFKNACKRLAKWHNAPHRFKIYSYTVNALSHFHY